MVRSATVRGAIVAERFVAGGGSKVVFESETEELSRQEQSVWARKRDKKTRNSGVDRE